MSTYAVANERYFLYSEEEIDLAIKHLIKMKKDKTYGGILSIDNGEYLFNCFDELGEKIIKIVQQEGYVNWINNETIDSIEIHINTLDKILLKNKKYDLGEKEYEILLKMQKWCKDKKQEYFFAKCY